MLFAPELRHTPTRLVQLPLLTVFVLGLLLAGGCGQPNTKPQSPVSTQESNAGLAPADQGQYEQALGHMQAGEFDRAQKILGKLQRKYRGHLGVNLNLASTLFSLNNLEQAESLCQNSLQLQAHSPEANNLMGLILVEKHQFKAAETHYLQALAARADYANAHYNLALLYDVYFQDIPKAYQHYQRYLALVPEDSDTKNWVEQLQYSLDRE